MRKINIVIGVIVFLVVMTSPVWINFGSVKAADAPKVSLDTPAINAMENKQCLYDTEYMRANHMEILHEWKIQVVREGNRTYVAPDGTEYEMSLQNTCLQCHSNYDAFCQECHDYSGVEPNCWQCHVNPSTENGDQVGGAA